MFVRVQKQNGDPPYLSLAYGILFCRQNHFITLDPAKNCFEFLPEVDASTRPICRLVTTIQPDRTGFLEFSASSLLKLKYKAREKAVSIPDYTYLCGYPDVCENLWADSTEDEGALTGSFVLAYSVKWRWK